VWSVSDGNNNERDGDIMSTQITNDNGMTFEEARYLCGWIAPTCQKSPDYGIPPETVEGNGWEAACERSAKEGYVYGVAKGCSKEGFRNNAAKDYYRLMHRWI